MTGKRPAQFERVTPPIEAPIGAAAVGRRGVVRAGE